MRLHPPAVAIKPDDPFAKALYARKDFAASLTSVLRSMEEGVVMFVNAQWGEGKTTFAAMWREQLRNQDKIETIYFDAYAADYLEDPFVSFTGEIIGLLRKMEGLEVPRRDFKKAAAEVAKRVGGLATSIAVRAATAGLLTGKDLGEAKELVEDGLKDAAKIAGELVEKRIEEYTAEKEALLTFRKTLAAAAKAYRDQYGFPLTIIVDELDRCRPNFALSLLERIKHLFDVDGRGYTQRPHETRTWLSPHPRGVSGLQVCDSAHRKLVGRSLLESVEYL